MECILIYMDILDSYHIYNANGEMLRIRINVASDVSIPNVQEAWNHFCALIVSMCHHHMPIGTQVRQDDNRGTFEPSGVMSLFRGLNRNFKAQG